ncbi:hypothetical protein [Rhodopirellula bahusiensis]|uniref:Uncharacterized protein n=1 Tax=Rhodopirellula bahusiensis TaxID=2014065 RepID=A0A2G1W3C5_9BACT|nr:hypothetical protein [Rhodopirellula bahusiensis]PHQ33537.1 hypothetical protein CEE69_19775 [Rhodopirellula bahusiensis]
MNPDPSSTPNVHHPDSATSMDPQAIDSGGTTLSGWAFQGMVVTFGLTMGCVFMGAILWMIGGDEPPQGNQTIFVLIGVVALVANTVVAFLVPAMQRSAAATKLRAAEGAVASARSWSQWPEREPMPMPLSQFCQTDQTARLIGQSVMEGTAIINFVMMFLTRSPVNLLCALVALLGVVAMFPTISRMRIRIASALEA